MAKWFFCAAGWVTLAAMSGLGACSNQEKAPAADKTPIDATGAAQWTPLFNGKDFDGFYTYLEKQGKNNDPNGLFRVENGMIHIMAIPQVSETQNTGYLATEKMYGNFDLRFEYKWGEKRFAPRARMPRDSGCHYLFTGDDKVWENAIECQIQEGETGDVYNLNNAYTVKTTVKSLDDRIKTFAENGVPWTMTGNRLQRSETADSLLTWNQVEIIVRGNSSTHIVNGKLVAHLDSITTRDGVPVTEGRIAFQEEAAEMYYRNIEIKFLK